MNKIEVTLVGTRGLLMHADILSDPLNALTKEHKARTSKKKKTDEDYEAIAHSEWKSSLYFDDELGPYIPSQNIEACICDGAKISRLGRDIKRSVEVMQLKNKLEFRGKRDLKSLWNNNFYLACSVKVKQARLMRYRPFFANWSVDCEVAFDNQMLEEQQVIKCLTDAGLYCGLCDFRPKYGRFDVLQRGK